MTIKVAITSYHIVYVDSPDDLDDATSIVVDKLREVFDDQSGVRLADCETTVDFAVPID